MCNSSMKCKTRILFISMVLSFLFGCIAQTNLFIGETGETPFGSPAETICFYDYLLDLEETSVSKHDISHEINEGDALLHFSKSKRVNGSSSSKQGLTLIKRNHILYTSSLKAESIRRFPSGLNEGRRHLISFGILII